IARQGIEGPPTDNAWTKASCTCSLAPNETCAGTCSDNSICCNWSQTPFGMAESATLAAGGTGAQTMLIAPFSAIQTGHGTEIIGPTDTVHACMVTAIASPDGASGSTIAVRRRVNGVLTESIWGGPLIGYSFHDCCWTPVQNSDLDTMEGGLN